MRQAIYPLNKHEALTVFGQCVSAKTGLDMKINRTAFRVTEILKLLANAPAGMSLSEIAQALDMPVTSAFDIVRTLRHSLFLREKDKRFYIGFMAREVGETYTETTELYGIAKEFIIEQANACHLVAALVLFDDDSLNYVYQYCPEGSIIAPGASSGKTYLHASATGKVFLAFVSEKKREKTLKSIDFKKFTPNTIDSLPLLQEAIAQVQQQGFAVDAEEFNPLLSCIAAPVMYNTTIVAAITFSGLQLSTERIQQLAPQIVNVSQKIGDALLAARH